MFKTTIASIAAVATLAIAAPASATLANDTATVRLGDLDLTNATHQRRMERRIDAAIRSVCDSRGPVSSATRVAIATCHAEVLAQVQPIAQRAILAARSNARMASITIRTAG